MSLSQTDGSSLISILSCSCCKSCAYQKVCFARICQRGRDRKGKGGPFPFLCFWFLLCHYKRNVSSFPLEKEPFLSCFPKQEKTVGTSPQRRKMIRCFKGTPKVRFRTVLRSVGQSRIPGFAIASTWCRLRLYRDCKSIALQGSTMVIHLTPRLCRPWSRSLWYFIYEIRGGLSPAAKDRGKKESSLPHNNTQIITRKNWLYLAFPFYGFKNTKNCTFV